MAVANALQQAGLVDENTPLEIAPSTNWDNLSLLVGAKAKE